MSREPAPRPSLRWRGTDGRLSGRVAIVTGAGRGIGRAESLQLAAEGARVVVNDLGTTLSGEGSDADVASLVVHEIEAHGGEAVASTDDVSDLAAATRIVETALGRFGRLDIVINNAGIRRPRMVFNLSAADWDAMVATNLTGHFTLIRAATPIFRSQRSGRIVNTSSEAGLGTAGHASYAATKEGVVGLTRAVSMDMARYGVTCNCIRPRAASRAQTADLAAAVERALATGEVGPGSITAAQELVLRPERYPPECVAAVAVFLCTDAAAHITGRDFLVGGREVSLLSIPAPEWTISSDEACGIDSLEVALRDRFA